MEVEEEEAPPYLSDQGGGFKMKSSYLLSLRWLAD